MGEIICYDSLGNTLEFVHQWDANRKIIITGIDKSEVTEVHFSNIDSCEALVVKPQIVENSICADIPNLLLQKSKTLIIHAFWDSGDNSLKKTVASARITVIPRAKPADYVYTETEVLRYHTLDARIRKLEEGGGASVTIDPNLKIGGAAADAKSVGDRIGDLSGLKTKDTSNLVAAINEVAKTGGSDSGKIVKTVNGVAPDENGNVQIEVGSGSGGEVFVPKVQVTQTANGATITITDQHGTSTATVNHGKDGEPGVYILAEGETIADAPADADVVIDPAGTPDVDLSDYAKTEDIPTDAHINNLINTALGVIENGSY